MFLISAQDCLLATNGNRALPNFVRPGGGSEPRFVKQPIQAIITSYRFNCCGVITEWGAIVERSGGRHNNGYYTITFQVWRPNSPSPVDTDGCYTMIGSNHFPNIVLDPDRAVRETPLASERIHFQPGDVIGFYLIGTDTDDNGIQFAGDSDNDSPYTEESVWYITTIIVPGSDPSCSFPVGSSGTLSSSTSLAPLITAAACELLIYHVYNHNAYTTVLCYHYQKTKYLHIIYMCHIHITEYGCQFGYIIRDGLRDFHLPANFLLISPTRQCVCFP